MQKLLKKIKLIGMFQKSSVRILCKQEQQQTATAQLQVSIGDYIFFHLQTEHNIMYCVQPQRGDMHLNTQDYDYESISIYKKTKRERERERRGQTRRGRTNIGNVILDLKRILNTHQYKHPSILVLVANGYSQLLSRPTFRLPCQDLAQTANQYILSIFICKRPPTMKRLPIRKKIQIFFSTFPDE